MNKTVNINLANTFFHIDEEAYNKLRRYLESIKRSFSGTTGSDEIIADIEARIAELFLEKIENERQVITQKEVDAVIEVMGQPEDYMVDEDIFEDAPNKERHTEPRRVKKLYRDIDQKYIGGVCSGLEHYLGFDAIWIRLIFIFLALVSSGGWVFIYILLWILIPEAATTSQKLDMTGKPINISNIERKVKEGFDDVAERVKNVDYDKVGNRVKSSSKTFFDTIGDIIMFLFKVFAKLIGILLIIIGAATLIGLFIGLFSVGIIDVVHVPGLDFYEIVNTSGAPIWLASLLLFFAIGIPFFFLLYLGLKILVNNLKSIGNIAKFSLLGLWLVSIGTLVVLGVRQAAEFATVGSSTVKDELVFSNDTILIRMNDTHYGYNMEGMHFGRMTLSYDENDNPILMSDDVRFNIKKSEDSVLRISIRKDSHGKSFKEARDRASNVDYNYALANNEIVLDDHLTTATSNKARQQEVRSTLYVPVGKVIKLDESTKGHIDRGTKNNRDYYRSRIADFVWVMGEDGELKCQECPEPENDNWSDDSEDAKVIINEDGVDINVKDAHDSFEMKIDEEGVHIKAKENDH